MTADPKKKILHLADTCVQCGLCLSHCPTYNVTQNENESPRGRIALMRAFAKDEFTYNEIKPYIDHCLNCLNCENMCPSLVKYNDLLHVTKQHQPTNAPLKFIRQQQGFANFFMWLYQKLGLQQIAKKTKLLKFLGLENRDQLLPEKIFKLKKLKNYYPANSGQGVYLFTSCAGNIYDQKTSLALIKILNRAKINVTIPKHQHCCGALEYHHGQSHKAKTMCERNSTKFNKDMPILCDVTGCTSVIKEYQLNHFSTRMIDSIEYLSKLDNLKFKPFPHKIILHLPCTLRNHLHAHSATIALLKKIPELNILKILNQGCCGSAGSYMVEFPKLASQVGNQLLENLPEDAEYLLSSNIGCALHISKLLKIKNKKLKILHPIQLVEVCSL